MEIDITTPALLFSAITLLMLAYTNRFLAVASLIREFIAMYEDNKSENILKQINNFKIRLKLMKYTQFFGVLSFLFCIISMLAVFLHSTDVATIIFIISLFSILISLLLSLYEIYISVDALNVEINKLK